MQDTCTGYIIDLYNKFARNDDVIFTFFLHGQQYCIREITKFNWGQPVFDKSIEDEFDNYWIYNTIEDAHDYIRYLKKLDGGRLV